MSRNGHDKNMTKMYGNGLMFWIFKQRDGLFLCRNDLIEHIGCKAGAMALSFIQCSHSHKILFFLYCNYDELIAIKKKNLNK
jgi:hypothetical protein